MSITLAVPALAPASRPAAAAKHVLDITHHRCACGAHPRGGEYAAADTAWFATHVFEIEHAADPERPGCACGESWPAGGRLDFERWLCAHRAQERVRTSIESAVRRWRPVGA